MKKLLACCALALTVGYVQAQTTAGRMMIGGNVGYTSEENDDSFRTDIKTFSVNPQFGYFVADNLAVGLQAGYYTGKFTSTDAFTGDEEENKYTGTSVTPFVRYYIFTPNEKFAFYAEAQAGIGFSKTDNEAFDQEEYKGRYFTAALSPGFSYFLNDKWALDLEFSGISYQLYDTNTDSDADNDKYSQFTLGASSLNPALGFRYFIGN